MKQQHDNEASIVERQAYPTIDHKHTVVYRSLSFRVAKGIGKRLCK